MAIESVVLPAGALATVETVDSADTEAQPATAESADPPEGAEAPSKKFSAFVTGGTLGLGPEVRYRFAPRWGVRGSATYIGLGLDAKIDGVDYNGDLRLGSAGVAVDYFLGRHSTWHISVGVRYDANEYRIRAQPDRAVTIGSRIFTPDQIGRISGKIEGKWQVAPTLTIGHVWGGQRGVQFGLEAGAMFHKALEVKDFTATGALGRVEEFVRELRAERTHINRDLDKLNVFPLVQVLVGFRF